MQAIYPTWFLLFVPPVVFITLLFDYAWNSVLITGTLACMKITKKWYMYKRKFFSIGVVSLAGDAAAAVIFLVLAFPGQTMPLVADAVLDSFASAGGFFIALAVVLGAGFLKYILNLKIVFKRFNILEEKQKKVLSAILGIASAPWTYLIPTALAYSWLGSLMMTLGGAYSGLQ